MREIILLILNFLKGKLRSELILKLLGSLGGLRGFLAKMLFDYTWKKAIKPAFDWAKRKINKYFSVKKKKKKHVKLKEAKNDQEWLDTLNSDTDI